MRKLLLSLVAGLAWSALSALAVADTPSGKAVGVDPTAEAQLGTASRTLIVGADVSLGETVVTGPAGEVQLLFTDQTRLVVGPKSSLKIEAYLLRGDNTVSQFAVDALAGSFRFITGKSAKDAYKIDTPAGTIGVRGTRFDFNVDEFGTTLVLYEGAVKMCTDDGTACVDMTSVCGVGNLNANNSSAASLTTAQQQSQNLRSRFPYTRSDSGLKSDFRIDGASKCLQPSKPVVTVKPSKPTKPTITKPSKPTGGNGSKPPPRHTNPKPPVETYQCPTHLTYNQWLLLRDQGIMCPKPQRYREPPEPAPGGLSIPMHRPRRHPPPDYGDGDGGSDNSTDGGDSGGTIIY